MSRSGCHSLPFGGLWCKVVQKIRCKVSVWVRIFSIDVSLTWLLATIPTNRTTNQYDYQTSSTAPTYPAFFIINVAEKTEKGMRYNHWPHRMTLAKRLVYKIEHGMESICLHFHWINHWPCLLTSMNEFMYKWMNKWMKERKNTNEWIWKKKVYCWSL